MYNIEDNVYSVIEDCMDAGMFDSDEERYKTEGKEYCTVEDAKDMVLGIVNDCIEYNTFKEFSKEECNWILNNKSEVEEFVKAIIDREEG